MDERAYFLSPIWLILAIISFFLYSDREENPLSCAVMSLLFGPIIIVIVIIAKISDKTSTSANQLKKKSDEEVNRKISSEQEREELISRINENKPSIVSKINNLQFQPDSDQKRDSIDNLQFLIDYWVEIEAISLSEYKEMSDKLRK